MASDGSEGRGPRRGGFALFEILAILGILAVFAAVLFPIFGNARVKARQSRTCLSNEKRMGLALLQYAIDNDDNMVLSWAGPDHDVSDPATGKYKWMDSIYPYINDEKVFDCPDDPEATIHPYRYYQNLGAPSDLNYGTYRINFAYYQSIPTFEPPAGNMASEPMSHLTHPSDTVLVLEGDATNPSCASTLTCPYDMAWPYPTTPVTIEGSSPRQLVSGDAGQNTVERHNGATNVLWCDGHVTACTLDFLNARHMAGGESILYHFTVGEN